MENIVPQSITQIQLDFDELANEPVPDLVEIGMKITPLADEPQQEQKHWWSDLQWQHVPRKSGIYAIVNMKDQSFYVGSATSLQERKHHHFRDLKADNHKNAHLQHAYNRDGAEAFRFCILEHVQHVENLLEREQHFIDTLDPHYNIARTAGSNLGMTYSDETKSKMSDARRAHPKMLEQMAKLNADRTGKPLSPEHRANIGAAQIGRKHSDASKERMSTAQKGKKKPEGHGENVRAAKLGKPRDPKTAEMLRTAQLGKKQSPDLVEKRIAPLRGRKRPPSVGAKVSATKRAKREAKLAEQQSLQPPLF